MEPPETVSSTLLQTATEHLQQAEKNFEAAKAQYDSAKATLQSARLLYEAAESSQSALIDAQGQSRLCESCLAIPVTSIFNEPPPFKVPRYKVGDLFEAIENQSSCILCKFLLEAFQLGDPEQS